MVPDLTIADATAAEDADALQRLAACLGLWPMTAADAPDGIWIDATGCTHLHGDEAPMAAVGHDRAPSIERDLFKRIKIFVDEH